MKSHGLFANNGGGLGHFFRSFILALRVNDFRAAFALGFGLLGHRAFHAVGQRHFLGFHGGDFDAPRFGLAINDLLDRKSVV